MLPVSLDYPFLNGHSVFSNQENIPLPIFIGKESGNMGFFPYILEPEYSLSKLGIVKIESPKEQALEH